MRKITFTIILVLSFNYIFAVVLSKERSIELAIENNLGLKASAEDIEIAAGYYREVRSSLLPQVQLRGGYQLSRRELPSAMLPDRISVTDRLSPEADKDTHLLAEFLESGINEQIPPRTEDKTNFFAGLKLDQVVYLGGKLMSGIRAANKYRNLEANRFHLDKRELVYETIDMFYQGLLLQDLLEINHQAIDLAEAHFKRVKNMYDQGLVSEYDLIRAELEFEKRKPELHQANNNYIMWKESFSKHLGIEREDVGLEGQIEIPDAFEPGLAEAISMGKEQRMEMFLSQTMKDMYEIQHRAERGNFLPNISLSAEVRAFSQREDFQITPEHFGTEYEVMLGLQMPLFTGFGNTAKVAQARHEYNRAIINHRQMEDNIELDVRNSWEHLGYARKKYEEQQHLVALAEKGLEIANARYENQVGINLEVMDAQLEYSSSQLSYKRALYELNISQVRLKKAMGIGLY